MNMPDMQKIESDIAFLREAVGERDQGKYTSVAIAILWATIVALGSICNDFFLHLSGWYWLIAPIIGFFASFYIGKKGAKAGGVISSREIRRHLFHWGSLFMAVAAILSIAYTHNFSGKSIGQLIFLVSGVGWFLGGLHLDKRFLIPGLVLIVGSAGADYVGIYPWTIIGLSFSTSLIISAIWMRPSHENV